MGRLYRANRTQARPGRLEFSALTRPRILFAVACSPSPGSSGGALTPRPPSDGAARRAAGGGPFHLTDQNGRRVDQHLLDGKWSAVFFGYTYCPDVCPTNLQTMAAAQDRLGPKAKDLQVIFISIDPQRDTPKALKDYLSSKAFPKGTIGLTGTPAEVDQAAKAYKAYYAKVGDGADYTMDHSTATYLMNPKGEYVRVIPYALSPDQVAADPPGHAGRLEQIEEKCGGRFSARNPLQSLGLGLGAPGLVVGDAVHDRHGDTDADRGHGQVCRIFEGRKDPGRRKAQAHQG